MLGLGWLLRPANPGVPEALHLRVASLRQRAWINFNIRFYLIALVFVIFDVEIAFVYR